MSEVRCEGSWSEAAEAEGAEPDFQCKSPATHVVESEQGQSRLCGWHATEEEGFRTGNGEVVRVTPLS